MRDRQLEVALRALSKMGAGLERLSCASDDLEIKVGFTMIPSYGLAGVTIMNKKIDWPY